ncbi:aldehyde dehydrogenase family protein [Streptomyces tirandamycinicus]|uniref:aldehyde dehydrogenase family protein n=1 Tax=Streptomyces tirandamycinicus TaxID=2174846 RepID=UPI003423BC1C
MQSGIMEATPEAAFPQASAGGPVPTPRSRPLVGALVPGLVDAVLRHRDELLSALTRVATAQAATDELFRSLRALSGAPWEILRNSPRRLGRLATFLPSNNLLYSYVLFGVIPSLYTEEVRIRPSARVAPAAMAVHEILEPHLRGLGGGRIVMAPVSQREFLAHCARSDAVVFTGQPDNGEAVAAHLPGDALLLAFGSGPNPLVVGPRADPDAVCRTVLDARLYNSGQDCLCTDVVFVHRSLVGELLPRLADALTAVPVGDRRDPGTLVAPLVYPDAVEGAAGFLAGHREFTVCGGRVDPARRIVEPTLVHLPWQDAFHPPEFFSPVVLTVEYDSPGQITRWLHSREETARGMYVSVFGEPALAGSARIATSVVCDERITFDAEDGNRPFGGYGPRAGHVRRHGTAAGRPLLLSAEAGAGAAS